MSCLSRFQDWGRGSAMHMFRDLLPHSKTITKLPLFFVVHINLDFSFLLVHKFSETFLELFPFESEQQLSILTRSFKKVENIWENQIKREIAMQRENRMKKVYGVKDRTTQTTLSKVNFISESVFRQIFYFLKDQKCFNTLIKWQASI